MCDTGNIVYADVLVNCEGRRAMQALRITFLIRDRRWLMECMIPIAAAPKALRVGGTMKSNLVKCEACSDMISDKMPGSFASGRYIKKEKRWNRNMLKAI